VVRVGVVAVSDSTGQQLAVGTLNARLAAMLGTLKSGLCRQPAALDAAQKWFSGDSVP